MTTKPLPSIELLRELFSYDPETGLLTRKISLGSRGMCGCVAGSLNNLGYLTVGILGRKIGVHRVAWAIHFGAWPVNDIDHKDGVKSHNWVQNLRDVTADVNIQNRKSAQTNNKTGLLGVSPNRARFSASIKNMGVKVHLGTYNTPEEAHAVYLKAKRELHLGCTI